MTRINSKQPQVVARLCSQLFPVNGGRDSISVYVPGKDVIKYDTVYSYHKDTVIRTVYRYIDRVDTVKIKEQVKLVDRAKEYELQETIKDQVQAIADIKSDLTTEKTKHKGTKAWLWRMVGLSASFLVVIIILLWGKISSFFSLIKIGK